MQQTATLLLHVRDREAWRIEKLVTSLRSCGSTAEILLVDFGSADTFSKQYEAIARGLKFKYEKLHAQGLPWNRCWAMNRGARLAETDIVCVTDVDVYFVSDPISSCIRLNDDRTIYHVETYWLDPNGNERRARRAGHGNSGAFQCVSRNAFVEAGGYDERFEYWGREDIDWPARLVKLGYKQVWLPEPHRLYHQWHLPAARGIDRPVTAPFNTTKFCLDNIMSPVLKQDWGRPLTRKDRPILGLMENSEPHEVAFAPNALSSYSGVEQLLSTRSRGFARLDIGHRIVKRPLSSLSGITKALLKPITATVGLECAERTNNNFDHFYALLPALFSNGLRDYHISQDLGTIHLYWN